MKTYGDVNEFLEDLYDEFMAENAWCAHAYGFEYMMDHYEKIVQIMKECELETAALESAYRNAHDEYERIANTEGMSFMVPEDRELLEEYDRIFLDLLAGAAQAVNEKLDVNPELRFY